MTSRSSTDCPRSVPSCLRCRRLKVKCDRKLPACSRCVSAGLACKGFSSVHDAQVPRSLVQHLEREVARVEMELAALGFKDPDIIAPVLGASESFPIPISNAASLQTPPSVPTGSQNHAHAQDPTRDKIVLSREFQAMISATMPQGPSLTDDVGRRVRMGLTPSLVLSSSGRGSSNRAFVQTRHASGEIDASILASLPTHIIYALVKKYVQRMLPVHPFLYEPTVWDQLDRVLRKIPPKLPPAHPDARHSPPSTSVVADYDFLLIYLILAVSTTLGSAEVGNAARCLAFSKTLFKEGIQHLLYPALHPSDTEWIQVTLLILQYVSINPKLGNVWILSGLAMRDCLELGFHRDMPENPTSDPLSRDLPRRIFWAAYCMDRSISAALQRPFSIPDPAIDAQVMSILPDKCITSAGLVHNAEPTKGLALRWIQYRQLQSYMTEIHFQGRPLNYGQSWEDWLAATEQRLWQWYNSDLPHDHWTEFVFFHGLVMLHRPSRRMPLPASISLFAAFEAATASARSCRESIVSGYFPRPWLAAHHMFSTSLVVLFCLRHDYATISQKYKAHEIFEMTKLFTSNLLTICAQGWSEVSEYAGIYERLLAPLLASILTRKELVSCSYTPEQDAELSKLLYPSLAHDKEMRSTSVALPLEANFNLSPFDTTILDWDEQLLNNNSGLISMLI